MMAILQHDIADQNPDPTSVLQEGTVANLLEELSGLGFVHSWKVENRRIGSDRIAETYGPLDVSLVATYRFEGISDPGDEQIVYAIQARDGTKGVLVDGYGAYATPTISSFMKEVEDARSAEQVPPLIA